MTNACHRRGSTADHHRLRYVAPPGTIDASNASTPGEIDPTIGDSATPTYRAVGEVNAAGQFEFTETSAFSGDNGRAAILDPEDGLNGTIFAVGNAGTAPTLSLLR